MAKQTKRKRFRFFHSDNFTQTNTGRKNLQGPSTALDPRDIEAIRRRLVAIRKAVSGDNQTEFARRIDIKLNRWNNLERGYPVSIGIVVALMRAVPGMTSSYILEGALERMPEDLVRQLSKFDPQLSSSGSSRRSSGKR